MGAELATKAVSVTWTCPECGAWSPPAKRAAEIAKAASSKASRKR